MSLTLTLERGGGEVSGSGTNIELDGTIAGGAIESVELNGDTQQQTYSGKNLTPFPYTDSTTTSNGITFTNNGDGSITMNGTNTGTADSKFYMLNSGSLTLPAGTYYVIPMEGITASQVHFSLYDGSRWIAPQYSNNWSFTLTAQTTFTQFYIEVYKSYRSQINNLKVYPMLTTQANPTVSDYEPYVGGTASPNPDYPQEVQTVTGRQVVTISDGGSESQEYEINLGKNLWNIADFAIGGMSRGNPTTTEDFRTNNALNPIPVESNTTYSIQFVPSDTVKGMRVGVHSCDENKEFVSDSGWKQLGTEPYTFTTGANIRYVKFVLSLSTTSSTVTTSGTENTQTGFANVEAWLRGAKLQFELGSATTYAPYFTPIELCKIGTYQDYIYKSGEDWYVHKELGKFNLADYKDLDGWYVTGGGGHCVKHMWANNFPITDIKPQPDMTSLGYGLSNYFTEYNYADLYNGVEKVGFAFGLDGIYLSNNDWTLEGFRTWITGKVVNMYYIKTTPTDTQITNSALIAQLEALNSAQTYDGETVITVSSEYLAGSLEVTAAASIAKTYTEVEIGSPFTITDVEGKSSNTTLDGNVYVDWAYNKKQYSFDLFNLTPQDYADIRAFYDYQFNNSAFPTITVPELNIDKLPVYMEISSRNIINQCLLTDKLTIKFRETVQP